MASQVILLGTFMPAFMLSGFLFDLRSMPVLVQLVTYVLPLGIVSPYSRLGAVSAGVVTK